MQLTIFQSNSTSDATNNAIAFLGRQNKIGTMHIVIVPDRFTLSQEKEIYEFLQLEGSFNIEVVSFSRLASRMVKQQKQFLSKEGTVMLMKKVLQKNISKLSYFNKLKISYGFAKEIFAVIASLRSSGITPEMLIEKADKQREKKFSDLAIIYSLYEQELKVGFSDSIMRYNQLLDTIKSDNTVSNTYFYVLGFNAFAEIQYKIIQSLCLHSLGVTIAAATDSHGANREIFPHNHLEELISFANANNIKINNKNSFYKFPSPFNTINKELFAFTKVDNINIKNKELVCLFEQKNPYEEIRVVAREINYLVKRGARYKEIAIICCQQEYQKSISSIFKRFNIPFFIDERYPASDGQDARFIFYILETLISNYRMDKVINLIKHPYFGISFEDACMFENYCLKHNINYSLFTKPFEAKDIDADIEIVRVKLIKLINLIANKNNVSEFTNGIVGLIEELGGEDDTSGDMLYNASKQIQQEIIKLLEEVNFVLGDEKLDIEEYYTVLREGINSLESALIPQYIDCVFVGNTSESRYNDIKYLFTVGANEGFFPLKTGAQTILTHTDTLYLQKCNLPVYPNPIEVNKLEKFVIVDLISRPERLYISCSSCNLLGEPMQLGEVIKELSYILGLEIKENIPHNEFNIQQWLMYTLGSIDNAYHELLSNRIPLQYKKCVQDFLIGENLHNENQNVEQIDDFDFAKYLFLQGKDGEYTTKVSQLESYFRCPYSHYLSYGLGLKEREIAGLKIVDIGNIIHMVLEVYFTDNLDKLKELNEIQVQKQAAKAINFVFNQFNHKRNIDIMHENKIKRIKEECFYIIKSLMQKIKQSSFSPKYIELVFDEKSQTMQIETSKGIFKLRGKIDRVDLCGEKVSVIDYKTGSTEDARLKYIYCGRKIQLYVYMSILAGKGYKPAGAFYLPIKDGYRSTSERFRLVGQIENDIATIQELDNGLFNIKNHDGSSVESEILSITAKLRKDGSIIPNRSTYLISAEEFNNIITYVHRLINIAIEEISYGFTEKSPLEEVCKYCIYKSHCDLNIVRKRQIKSIPIEVLNRLGDSNEMD